MKKTLCLLISISLWGCANHDNEYTSQLGIKSDSILETQFTDTMAKENLAFIKDQYVKMIGHIDNNNHVKFAAACANDNNICFPRAEEDGEIYLEQPAKWTNGFYPGLLWKLLAANDKIKNFPADEQQLVLAKAKFYQDALMPETQRGSTHDLGFILYDSFGEALEYDGLTTAERNAYTKALDVGRATLASRFDKDKGVIKSWDWGPTYPAHYLENGKVLSKNMELADPWTFPVIVDNMMNLEFLMSSSNTEYRELAFSHADQTYYHQYFYAADDKKDQYPIAYHLFDYDSMRPGNWQGVGNISAWARGQGWSLYGYVTVIEALKQQDAEMSLPNFDIHVANLVNAIEHFLKNDPVPIWDYYASAENAFEIAEDQSRDTTHYSRILDLCDFEIAADILPYNGYKPVKIDKDILSTATINELSTMTSAYNQPFIQGDKVLPCGSQSYQRNANHIPKDTSAAALYASALYRLAKFTTNTDLRDQSIKLGDRIMAELTAKYLTLSNKGRDFELGFALVQATGNMPNASEINTSIVYADFYFLEANIRKLALAQ
ncbi:glycoside hydrolase family 88 protein [Shewanella sp. UCD-KL21]|uniref:glycoside hydrolase family 88 protein n=1 Tax=Shewanella sp. UCD-KL21 TaxID=1917164 RepID=UPI000970C988|nr:glycoside hydrolase family 88 protein [Shewanella sp. UCD-KL21]